MAHALERTINRYYDPATGQFVSVDPMVAETNQPYDYADDDPVNGVDPNGTDPTELLPGQGWKFVDAALAKSNYFDYGSFNDLSTVLVNAINAPFVSVYDAYDNIFHAGQDGCSLTTVIALTGDAVTADIGAGLFLTGDPEGEALDAAAGSASASRALELAGPTTVDNASSPIRSFVTSEERTYYRVFSGSNTEGAFLTGVPPESSQAAVEGLSLPPGNTAEYLQEVNVPVGIRLQSSIAGAAYGQEGGLLQYELLERLDSKNFGSGTLFP
jgi:hypothetical protein